MSNTLSCYKNHRTILMVSLLMVTFCFVTSTDFAFAVEHEVERNYKVELEISWKAYDSPFKSSWDEYLFSTTADILIKNGDFEVGDVDLIKNKAVKFSTGTKGEGRYSSDGYYYNDYPNNMKDPKVGDEENCISYFMDLCEIYEYNFRGTIDTITLAQNVTIKLKMYDYDSTSFDDLMMNWESTSNLNCSYSGDTTEYNIPRYTDQQIFPSGTLTFTCLDDPSNGTIQDTDDDTIIDAEDNCSGVANLFQFDLDHDGKGDACDKNIFLRNYIFDPVTESNVYDAIPMELKSDGSNPYYIVQYKDEKGDQVFDYLESLSSSEFIDHMQEDVLLFKIPNNSLNEIKSNNNVRNATLYEPAFKLGSDIFTAITNGDFDGNMSQINSTVTFFSALDLDTHKTQIENLGATFNFITESKEIVNITIPKDKVLDLIKITGIKSVFMTLPTVLSIGDAGEITKVHESWKGETRKQFMGLTGKGQTISIADTGLSNGRACTDKDDCNKVPNCGNKEELGVCFNSDIHGRIIKASPLGVTDTVRDYYNGHGTHVVGIAIGNGENSRGDVTGVAPKAELYFLGIVKSLSAGTIDTEKRYVENKDAKIFSNSFGTGAPLPHRDSSGNHQITQYRSTIDEITDKYLFDNPEKISVAVAGNRGEHRDYAATILSPGSAKNIITVGSSENNSYFIDNPFTDNPSHLAANSGFGPADVGKTNRIKPDVVAPGQFIYSLRPPVDKLGSFTDDPIHYTHMAGTSMAASHVAGMLALINQHLNNEVSTTRGDLLKAFLINGAVDIGQSKGNFDCNNCNDRVTHHVPNYEQGWGRINIEESLKPCGDSKCLFFDSTGLDKGFDGFSEITDLTPVSKDGETKSYKFQFTKGQTVSMTLAWYDTPGAALHNNLDLMLQSPDGTIWYGGVNGFHGDISDPPKRQITHSSTKGFAVPVLDKSDGFTKPFDSSKPKEYTPDKVNNVEKMIVNIPKTGIYTLDVIGTKITTKSNTFGYSLVVSGIGGIKINDVNISKEIVKFSATGLEPEEKYDLRLIIKIFGNRVYNDLISTSIPSNENGTIIGYSIHHIGSSIVGYDLWTSVAERDFILNIEKAGKTVFSSESFRTSPEPLPVEINKRDGVSTNTGFNRVPRLPIDDDGDLRRIMAEENNSNKVTVFFSNVLGDDYYPPNGTDTKIWVLDFDEDITWLSNIENLSNYTANIPNNPQLFTITKNNTEAIILKDYTDSMAETIGEKFVVLVQYPNSDDTFDDTFDPDRDDVIISKILSLRYVEDDLNILAGSNGTENQMAELKGLLNRVNNGNLNVTDTIFNDETSRVLDEFLCHYDSGETFAGNLHTQFLDEINTVSFRIVPLISDGIDRHGEIQPLPVAFTGNLHDLNLIDDHICMTSNDLYLNNTITIGGNSTLFSRTGMAQFYPDTAIMVSINNENTDNAFEIVSGFDLDKFLYGEGTPIVSTRNHTERCNIEPCGIPIVAANHTATDYDLSLIHI